MWIPSLISKSAPKCLITFSRHGGLLFEAASVEKLLKLYFLWTDFQMIQRRADRQSGDKSELKKGSNRGYSSTAK